MIRAQISAVEYHLPDETLTNEELAGLYPQWTAEKILEKTGIASRRLAGPDETASDLAVLASQRLFERGASTPSEIDFVILCTQTPDYLLPTSACLIQDRLGIPKAAGALDFNLGCSGYIYGLAICRGLIETGLARNILLLTGDTYSKLIHPMDRSVRTLFGDAATATLVRGVERDPSEAPFLGPFVFGTDGAGAQDMVVRAGGLRLPVSEETSLEEVDEKGYIRSKQHLCMDGPAIFTFSMKCVPLVVEGLLEASGLTREDVDWFVFHQANAFMLETLRKLCRIERDHFIVEMADKGNTVSSTIPIAMVDAQRKGLLKPLDKLMLGGFGVGLSWGGALAVLPESI